MTGSTSVKEQLENTRTIWILVDRDGRARLAVPAGFPLESAMSGSSDPWGGLSLDQAIQDAQGFMSRHPEWMALVSVLRATPGAPEILNRVGRELHPQEYVDLQDLGMDVPFGEWARREQATIYLLGSE